jgi:hypothetical protein
MSAACGVLLLLSQQVIVLTDPPSEITLPIAYQRTVSDEIFRQVGPESWTRVRFRYRAATGPLSQPTGALAQASVEPLVRLPKDAAVTFEARPWKEYQSGWFLSRHVVGTLPTLELQAVIPLHPKALLLTLEGAEALEKEMRSDLDLILAALNGRSAWKTPAMIERERTADRLDLAGLALAGIYLPAWIFAFRAHFMRAHWIRVAWLTLAALALLSPALMRTEIGLYQVAVNLALPLALLGFAGRRLKLAVEYD